MKIKLADVEDIEVDGITEHPIRTLRKERGWTQHDLERRSGVTVRTLSRIEQGYRSPHRSTRYRILRAFGLPMSAHVEYFGAVVPKSVHPSKREAAA